MHNIIGIAGKKYSGKTTVANYLVAKYGAELINFSDPLKRTAQKVMGFTDAQLYGTEADKESIDPRYGFSCREFLKRLGTDGMRDEFFKDIHIEAMRRMLSKTSGSKLYVIADVRFDDEASFIATSEDHNGVVFQILSDDEQSDSHESEQMNIDPGLFAATIYNNKALGLGHLYQQVETCLHIPFNHHLMRELKKV